ncbi:hypothetical protein 65p379 [Aeromonas phage 65]|uniref:Uncharacterized protein n=1 Tax=Aeromonas phage 65 TaxID=2919549 RepID=E5DSL3_9CAUD|nr:hypothetical protein ST65p379 [Aeromonas phage 65]ADQ53386.1 hypothetical protein 65p379 [Aeromonas phage 65]
MEPKNKQFNVLSKSPKDDYNIPNVFWNWF